MEPASERKPKTPRLIPTIDHLTVFCGVYRILKDRPHTSLRTIATDLNRSASIICEYLAELQTHCKVRLLSKQGTRPQLTPDAHSFYEQASKLLSAHEQLRNWSRAPATDKVPDLRVGATHGVLVNLLPGATGRFLRTWRKKVKLDLLEWTVEAILQQVKQGRVEFGLGPAFPRSVEERHRDVHFEVLKEAIDVVLVFHAGHPFAQRMREGSDPIDPAELSRELVLLLPEEAYPGVLQQLPPSDPEGGRLVVMHYSTILAYVTMELGVAVVPGYYWRLDELAKQGRIGYCPLPGLGPIRTAAYLPPGGPSQLSPAAAAFLESFRQHLGTLQLKADNPGTEPTRLPASVRRYRYQYFVSCHPDGNVAPEWHRGHVRFVQQDERGRREVTGEQVDFDEHDRITHAYEVHGELLENLFCYTAREPRNRKGPGRRVDAYTAVFNYVDGKTGALVGTWTGHGDNAMPTSAPMILTREEVKDVQELIDILRRARIHWIPNADEGAGLTGSE